MNVVTIVTVIFFLCLGLLIFYSIIMSAIDNSQTAKNIRDIRMILSKQYPGALEKSEKKNCDLKLNIQEMLGGRCPACSSKVLNTDIRCPSCGELLEHKEQD